MKTEIFLDTNLLIDYLSNREPFADQAEEILSQAEAGRIRINVSSLSFSHIYYILKKFIGHQKIIEYFEQLSLITTILPVDFNVLQKAMMSGFKDFEDSLQYFCALQSSKVKIIVTRNKKDFKNSSLLVMTPEEFLNSLKNQ